MAQEDYNIANQTFPATRADINNQLSAILSQNSGTSAPTTTTAGMFWYDTTNGKLKQRNAADSAWVTLWSIDDQGLVPQAFTTVYGADAGSTDAYAITLDPAPAAWSDIGLIIAKVNTPNTGAATLNPNSLGARTIKKNYNSDLATGDLLANQVIALWNDGTNLQLLSPTSASTSTGPYPKGYYAGPRPYWNTAAQIVIPSGTIARDSTDTYNIELTSDRTIDITTSGAGGLDTGSEASDTWYYVYLIDDSTLANSGHAMISTTNEAASGTITLPSGYDIKRQLPLAIRNDGSSNIIPFDIVGWGSANPFIQWNVWQDATGSGPTNVLYVTTSATTFTNVDCSAYIPPISEMGSFHVNFFSSANIINNLREDGQTHDGIEIVNQTSSNFTNNVLNVPVSSSQLIEYKSGASGTDSTINVYGYYSTEVY